MREVLPDITGGSESGMGLRQNLVTSPTVSSSPNPLSLILITRP